MADQAARVKAKAPAPNAARERFQAMAETWRRRLRRVLERGAGVRLFRTLPAGVDLASDMRRWLPGLEVQTVFDIGAHKGSAAAAALQAWPGAVVHAFEPEPTAFAGLRRRFAREPRVRLRQLALGAGPGRQGFVSKGSTSRLVDGAGDVAVDVARLDEVCARSGVAHIGVLKIDVEGRDLEVLQSGAALLARAAVDLVQVEAGMNPTNALHVPFPAFLDHLGAHGYQLFGFYDQQHEWSGAPMLRRADAAFISPRVAREQRWR